MIEYTGLDAVYYDLIYDGDGVPGDVQFYVEEACRSGSPVLELGCGTGRILIPTAQAGIDIVGLDRSADMLAVAREKIAALEPETASRIRLVEGDMRSFSLGERFNLIAIPFRAFLHLLAGEDQRAALTCIREHLADDGRLIFNIFDPKIELIAAHLGTMGTAQQKLRDFVNSETGRRVIVWAQRVYNIEEQIIHEERIFEEVDNDGRVVSRSYIPLILRWIYRYEMAYLLELCGYKIEALYGDFQRGPFREGREQIWVVRGT
ncbi:MAG: class I SAM-dependent methyltransferase [Anaerolineae bacterium]|nr:class I SAM-dependent methyltransferase [Anaerolineae bacterium]